MDETIQFIYSINSQIENGEIDPVTWYIQLKKIEKALDDAKEYAYAEASKHLCIMNKLELENLPLGAKWRETGRTTYEYSANEWYKAKQEEVKRIEKLIKIATDNQSCIADPETGEQIYAVPFKKTVTYAITI